MDELLVLARFMLSALGVKSERFLEYFSIFVDLVVDYRKKMGSLPYLVFVAVGRIAGYYYCVEVIFEDEEGRPLLKKRDPKENVTQAEQEAWNGLHIIGSTFYVTSRLTDALPKLLKKEGIVDEKLIAIFSPLATTVTTVIYPEEVRADALTTIYRLRLTSEQMKSLKDPEKWQAVDRNNISEVIEQHRELITQYIETKGNLPNAMDFRPAT